MDDNDGINEPERNEAAPSASKGKTRDLIAFWIFGLCNNYGYVVMLTAAIDIINSDTVSKSFRRICHYFDFLCFSRHLVQLNFYLIETAPI